MTDTALQAAASSAAASIGAPVKAAAESVATSLGSVIDTAAERGRKARKEAGKRARAEVGHRRRVVRKQAKQARKQSRQAWADFAEETAQRATNIVEAGRGARVTRHRTTWRVTGVLAVVVTVAIVVVRKKQAVTPATTGQPSAQPTVASRS